MPEESGPGGWEVAVDGFADETRGRHEPERSAVTAGGLVVAADLETGWENCHHPLDEQPRGLDRVVQGDDVADQRTARAYDDQPITVGECRQHARALDLYPLKKPSRHEDCHDDTGSEGGAQDPARGEATRPAPCPVVRGPGIT